MTFYAEIRKLGAMYAELQPKSSKRFFQVDREDGETFVWIGRFHFILTPWKRLSTGLAALWGFLLDNNSLAGLLPSIPAVKSAAAATVLAVVGATSTPAVIAVGAVGGAAVVSTPYEAGADADLHALAEYRHIHMEALQWRVRHDPAASGSAAPATW
jgi:hypothetical protein